MGMHTVLVIDNEKVDRVAEDKVGLVSACLAAERGGAADSLAPDGVTVVSSIDASTHLAVLHDDASFRVLNGTVATNSKAARRIAAWLAAAGGKTQGRRQLSIVSVEELERLGRADPGGDDGGDVDPPRGLAAITDTEKVPTFSCEADVEDGILAVEIDVPLKGGGTIGARLVQTAKDAAEAADSGGIWGHAEIVPSLDVPHIGEEGEEPGRELVPMPEWGAVTHHALDLTEALARSPEFLARAVLGWLEGRMADRPVARPRLGGTDGMLEALQDAVEAFWPRDERGRKADVSIEVVSADLGKRRPSVRISDGTGRTPPWRALLAAEMILLAFAPWGGDVRLVEGRLSVAAGCARAVRSRERPDETDAAAGRLWTFFLEKAGYQADALRERFGLPADARGFAAR